MVTENDDFILDLSRDQSHRVPIRTKQTSQSEKPGKDPKVGGVTQTNADSPNRSHLPIHAVDHLDRFL